MSQETTTKNIKHIIQMTRKLWMECETHISIYQNFKKGAQLWNPWVGPHTCHAYLHSIGIMCSKFHLKHYILTTDQQSADSSIFPLISLLGGIMNRKKSRQRHFTNSITSA